MRNNLIFNLQTRTGATWGAAAALVAMGAGAPGIEGMSSGTKRIEEARMNSMGGSPRAEDDGSGRISKVNRGGAVWTAGTAVRRLAGAKAGAAVLQGQRRACSQGLGQARRLARLALYRGLAPVRGLAAMDVLVVPAMDTGQRLGPDGLHTGTLVGPDEMGRAFGLGPVEFCFFFYYYFLKYIFSAKEFQRNSSNSFKALNILRKSQKF
jgi:hypothetical protein